MAKDNGRVHPQHTIAAPNDRWNGFGDVAKQLGTDRSKLLNTVMAWYRREPGAVLPRRPVMPTPESRDGSTS